MAYDMILGDDALSALYRFLVSKNKEIGLGKERFFKYEVSEKLSPGDYIAINHLPFVYDNVVNEGVINVNIHCPKTAQNLPDTVKLKGYVQRIMRILNDNEIYIGGCYFNLYAVSRPTEDNDDTYYVNMKFNVTYNNLKE